MRFQPGAGAERACRAASLEVGLALAEGVEEWSEPRKVVAALPPYPSTSYSHPPALPPNPLPYPPPPKVVAALAAGLSERKLIW